MAAIRKALDDGQFGKEIANLTWRMVTDSMGQIGHAIHLENAASRGRSGRVIPMNETARAKACAKRATWFVRRDLRDPARRAWPSKYVRAILQWTMQSRSCV